MLDKPIKALIDVIVRKCVKKGMTKNELIEMFKQRYFEVWSEEKKKQCTERRRPNEKT